MRESIQVTRGTKLVESRARTHREVGGRLHGYLHPFWPILLAVVCVAAPSKGQEAAEIEAPATTAGNEDAGIPLADPTRNAPEGRGETAPQGLPTELIRVTIVSPRKVQLYRQQDSGSFEEICTSPCDIDVAKDGKYRIDASGIRPSDVFSLEAEPDNHVRIQVDPASGTVKSLGTGFIIAGFSPAIAAGVVGAGGAVILGVVMILVCPFVDAFGGDFGECAGDIFGEGAKAYGGFLGQTPVWGTIAGGVALGSAGIVMVAKNGRTKVSLGPGESSRKLGGTRVSTRPLDLPSPVAFPLVTVEF